MEPSSPSSDRSAVAWSRGLRGCAFMLGMAAVVGVQAQAPVDAYPNRPVRLVVPYAPGGNIDITGRIIGPAMSDALGASFVIDNRAGAGGAIGSELVARAPPDGYTLLVASTGSTSGLAALYPKLPYDPVRDFAPIGLVSNVAIVVVVTPGLPARNIKEFIALAKARPGHITYGSGGTGTTNHLAAALFEMSAGVKLTHVPYKGMGPATVDLMGGQIDVGFDQLSAAIAFIKSGKTRALALASPTRSKTLPDLPTLTESGVTGADASTFTGIMAPAKTPRDIVDRLHADMKRVLAEPEIKQKIEAIGLIPFDTPGIEALVAYRKAEQEKWGGLVKKLGLEGSQ